MTLQDILRYINQLTLADGSAIFYGDADDGHVFKVGDESSFLDRLLTGYILFDNPEYGIKPRRFGTINRIFFGDEACHKFSDRSVLEEKTETKVYDKQGHIFFRNPRGIVAHFNAAPLGYLTTAAHGHADALSFALFVNGTPILVDPGTYSYHKEPEERNYFKSTAAHNTVEIDGENQARNVAPMIWLKHYECVIDDISLTEAKERVGARHNGYDPLGCSHHRLVQFEPDSNRFLLSDTLTSVNEKEHEAVIRFHMHPDLSDIHLFGQNITMRSSSGTCVSVKMDNTLDLQLVKGWFSDAFYTKRDCFVIEGRLTFKSRAQLNTLIEVTCV